MRRGVVYTETVVHLAPERFATDVPYQVVIVNLEGGGSVTARVEGERLQIGDAVEDAAEREGIPYFRKSS